MKKLFVILVIISVCLGVLGGYVSSEGPGKLLESIESLLSGSKHADSTEVENRILNAEKSDEDETSEKDNVTFEKEEKPLLSEDDDLLRGLKLNDPDDMNKAADIILDAARNYSTDTAGYKLIAEKEGDRYSDWYRIMTPEVNADILYAAHVLYQEQKGKEIPELSKKLKEIDKELGIGFNVSDPKVVYSGEGESTVAVLLRYTLFGGMSRIPPTVICVSRDRGETWKCKCTTFTISNFTVSEDGDFTFLSDYISGTYAIGTHPGLIYYDRSQECIYYQYISFVPGYDYEYYFDMDILSITEGAQEDRSDHYVTVGYRGSKEPAEEESYFLIVKYGVSDEEDKEVILRDDDFVQRLRVIAQSMCGREYYHSDEEKITRDVDFIFHDSNERYLKYEEILEWKQFTEKLQDQSGFDASDCYKAILRRAINEIYARKGYDFTGTTYTLFNDSEWYKEIPKRSITEEDINEIEKHNIDLLAAIEAEISKNTE